MDKYWTKLKTHELFFLLAGLSTLVALPFMDRAGFLLWAIIKAFYLLGVIFFVAEVLKDTRKT